MTPEELKQELARREEINRQLAELIADEEQIIAATTALEGADVAQLTVTLDLPTGEAMVAHITTKDGQKLRYATSSPSADMLQAMIDAGLAHAANDITTRKTALLAQL
jgi:hypothetical protein